MTYDHVRMVHSRSRRQTIGIDDERDAAKMHCDFVEITFVSPLASCAAYAHYAFGEAGSFRRKYTSSELISAHWPWKRRVSCKLFGTRAIYERLLFVIERRETEKEHVFSLLFPSYAIVLSFSGLILADCRPLIFLRFLASCIFIQLYLFNRILRRIR